jgi:arylformamidase
MGRQLKWPRAARRWFLQSIEQFDAVKPLCRIHEDVSYADHKRCTLDIYEPARTTSSHLPVVVFIHGGYFTNGDKRIPGGMAPAICDMPAIFVSINYRLAPSVRVDTQVDDVMDAIAWVYHHISDYYGNSDQIIVGGHSAGGHLAAWAALHPDALEARYCPSDVIKACFPVSGVFDFHNSVPRVTRFALEGMADAYSMSPINHTAANRVPFYLAISEYDAPDLIVDHNQMLKNLKKVSCDVEEIIILGHNHFSQTLNITGAGSLWIEKLKEILHGGNGCHTG